MSDGNRVAPSKKRPWTFQSTHPDFLHVVYDFGELAEDATDVHPGGGGSLNWIGGFSGRPGLLQDLMPTIAATYAGRSPLQVRDLKSCLRAFWRFSDAYEAWLMSNGVALPRIDHLHQVSGAILQAFSEPGPEGRWKAKVGTPARVVRALILDAVHNSDLAPMSLAALSNSRSTPKDVVSEEEGIQLIRHLRGAVTQIFHRWKRADRLAEKGSDLVAMFRDGRCGAGEGYRPSEADAHATYRALIQSTGHPLPYVSALLSACNRKGDLPGWWPRYQLDHLPAHRSVGDPVSWRDCAAGLYPTSADVATCALLCLGRSAWNPVVLLSIDIDDWSASYDEDHAWIHSRKDRAGGTIQHGISALRHPTGFYQVVSRLIARNAPLRAWLVDNRDAVSTPALALRSPWLGSSIKPSDLFYVADPRSTSTLNNWLTSHILEHNRQSDAKVQVSKMTTKDFRTVAAAAMYRESRYSMWVIMLMLGHKDLATTRSYVYRHAGRQESHRLVVQVVGDVMDQIERTQAWDPVITRAHVEGVDVTPEARQRLEAHRKRRTYAGALCNDPCHPPTEIDPTHPQDGRSHCIQGHLCIARACPQATALNDSLGDICKCVADLEWRQLHSGAVRFSTGSEDRDLEHLRETLKQWPFQAVEQHLALWRGRIQRGEHRPIWFGGQR